MSVHREPGEETTDLYPGFVVSDGQHSRASGSITVGRSRLPMWAFIGQVVEDGWDTATEDYFHDRDREVLSRDDAAWFFHDLMQQRGEFGRLALLLADVERRERKASGYRPWWDTKVNRRRMAVQLRRCLALVEDGERGA